MKATGIVRRIDDLGRVVIPKEIRRTLRIKDGESLEIYTGRDGEIILKKYSQLESIGDYAKKYCEAMYETTSRPTIVTDTDQILSVVGNQAETKEGVQLLPSYIRFLVKRKQSILSRGEKDFKDIYPEFPEHVDQIMITPIIKNGDVIGGVMTLKIEGKPDFTQADEKLGVLGANYFSNQMH